jgi:hypothetical protein
MTPALKKYLQPDPNLPPVPAPQRVWTPPLKSRGTRRVALGAKHHENGAMVVNDVVTAFESGFERKAAKSSWAFPGVKDVIDQFPKERYLGDDGAWHSHTFDYLVVFEDGIKRAVSVKPLVFVESSNIRRIHQLLAAQMSPATANQINLVTEQNLGRDDIFNGELICALLQDPNPEQDAVVERIVAGLIGSTTIGELAGASGLKGYGFRAAVRLIASGRLQMVEKARITHNAVVRRPDRQA